MMNDKKRRFYAALCIFLILLIAFVSFLPSLKNGFNYDDYFYIRDNSFIKSISLYNLKKIFTSFFIGNYQPLSILTYSFEYHFFQLNPAGYHITSLILHLLNCLFVFWLFYLISRNTLGTFLVAILFAIHPLRVESVAWISERKDLLYALFFLGALISYVYYLRKEKKIIFYWLAIFAFILSLLSKSMAVTLPAVLLLVDYYFNRKLDKSVLLEKLPFFVLSLIFGCVAILSQYSVSITRYDILSNLPDKIMNAGYGAVFYLNKIFLPTGLSCFYNFPDKTVKLLSLAQILLVFLIIILFFKVTRSKRIVFGAGFYLITIIPVLQFFPLGSIPAADRYSYIPSLGIYYLVSEAFLWLFTRRVRYFRYIQALLSAVLIIAISILSFLTWERCKVWENGVTLWSDVIKKDPNSIMALNERGYAFLEMKDYDNAIVDFNRVLNMNFNYVVRRFAYLNLVRVYDETGNKYKMIGTLQEAANKYPLDAELFFYLGKAYSPTDKQKSIAYYNKSITLDPFYINSYYNLGALYAHSRETSQAIVMFKKIIAIDPDFLLAYVKLAELLKNSGNTQELSLLYKKAVEKKLGFFDAYYYVGGLYQDAGDYKQAIALYKRAIRIKPESAEACLGLGSSYCVLGKNKEAILWLERAIKLNPDFALAHNNLAAAYYFNKEYSLAIKHCDKAIELGGLADSKLLDMLKPYRLQKKPGIF